MDDFSQLTEEEKLEKFKELQEALGISDDVKKKTFDLVQLDISKDKDQIKFDRKIKEILAKKAENKIFKVDNDKNYIIEFVRTFIAIGINDKKISSSNLINLGKTDKSFKNHETNYKNWLGKKLLLGKEDRAKKSVEDINNMASVYINLAIEHIKKFSKDFNKDEFEELKSEFFETIHTTGAEQKTVYQYIEMLFQLEKDKKEEEKKDKPSKHALKNIEIRKFEIQRLLGLALLYLDREKNHVHQHVKEDIDFIIGKLLEIVPQTEKKEFSKIKTKSDNPLYPYTNTYYKYWKKDENGYSYSDEAKEGYKKLKLESLLISGEYRDYKENKVDINLKHIDIREEKSGFSSIEKLMRKGLSSFKEILDDKGFIFVVDNYEEGEKLLRIIENKLGTLRSSWVEEPKRIKKNGGNKETSSDYDCMKGVLKIPYKGKLLKHFFELLDSHMDFINGGLKKSFIEFKSGISGLDFQNDESLDKLETLVEELKNTDISNMYHELKTRFKEKSYNIEVEIQIFDMENYMKAEIDPNSHAYHGKYKMRQQAENIPIYFPKELYGETNIEEPIRRIIKENS